MCFNMDHSLIPCHQSQKHYGNVNGIRVQDESLLSNFLNTDGFSHHGIDIRKFYRACGTTAVFVLHSPPQKWQDWFRTTRSVTSVLH